MFLLLIQLDEEIQPTAAFGPPVPLEKPRMLPFISGKIATWSVFFAASRWLVVLEPVTLKTHERFKRKLFIRTKQNVQIFGVIPFIKLQNYT